MSPSKSSLDALRIDRTALPAKRSSAWIWILIIALLIIGAGVYFWLGREGAPVVETVIVREQAAGSAGPKTSLNASGYITARRAATVSSKVTGKVTEIIIEEGMAVKAGQVLARLDASNVEASYRLAQAQLESARSSLHETRSNMELAGKELTRFTSLVGSQAGSQSDLDRADAQSKMLNARLQKQTAEIAVAEAEVAQWKQQVDDTIIVAPFGGIVTTKNSQPGEMISPMSVGGFTRTGICTIVDMSSLEIEVDVNESYINRVEAGQAVDATLDSYPDVKFPAKVIAIIPTADRQKATVKVRVGFEKIDPRILPDMAVKVAFRSKEITDKPTGEKLLALPKSAIDDDNGRTIVWVVAGDKVERRAVNVSQTSNDESAISAGLSNGEEVVIKKSAKLSDGMSVKITKR